MESKKIIAVDFDGTLCENKWPGIGAANQDLIRYLLEQQEQGAKLILWTCRHGDRLDEAVCWCEQNGLCFDAINENLPESIELFGEDTRKVFANEYIDDRMSDKFDLPYRNGGNISDMQRCPICGKYPKIKRDIGYEYTMFGSWCTIQCKPFLRKPHLKIEEGKSSWDRALKYGIKHWNEAVKQVKESLLCKK